MRDGGSLGNDGGGARGISNTLSGYILNVF